MNKNRMVTRENIERTYETAVADIERTGHRVYGNYSLDVTEGTAYLLLSYYHTTSTADVEVLRVKIKTF